MDTGGIKTQKLGIDMGTSKIKIAVCSESGKAQVYEGKHYGRILDGTHEDEYQGISAVYSSDRADTV